MIRRFFQAAMLLLIVYVVLAGGDVEGYCPAGGMASLAGQLVHGRMSCQMTAVNIFAFLSVVLSVVLAGRLFCSFLCPVGTAAEAFTRVTARLGCDRLLPRPVDLALRSIKYILLYLVLAMSFDSSELFCKKFDPYYACAGGFAHETVAWAAVVSLLVLFAGPFLGRLFWCKYACFFSAGQAVAGTLFGPLAAVAYMLLCRVSGSGTDYHAVFALVCIGGYAGELFGQRYLPILKVRRDDGPCTRCGLCEKACPHGIRITDFSKVTHADCHLCGACVEACPVDGALVYSPAGNRWLAPLLVVVLVAAAFAATARWGETSAFATVRMVPEGLLVDGKTVAVYERHGVRSIHCWGSSMSFLLRLGKRKPGGGIAWNDGILGAETFAATHSFRVFYDPRRIDREKIKAMIFRAGKFLVAPACKASGVVSVLKVGVFGLVGDYDLVALKRRLSVSPHVFAFSSKFGEPVIVTLYYDGKAIGEKEIQALIEKDEPLRFGDEMLDFHFKLDDKRTRLPDIDRKTFIESFFPFRRRRMSTVKPGGKTVVVEAELSGLDDPDNGRAFLWLCRHLAALPGLVSVSTGLRDLRPILEIESLDGKVSLSKVESLLRSPVLVFEWREKKIEKKNPFVLKGTLRRRERMK